MTTIPLDISASGQALAVAPGDRLAIELEENRTTGFRWQVEADESGVLVLERDDYVRPSDAPAGRGGARVLVFGVAKPGRAVLRLSYRRSWEAETAAQETFELTVTAS